MQITVTGRNIEVTNALKDYVIDKLQRAQKHFDHELHCKATLSVAKNPSIAKSQTAEVTVQLNGQMIRGAESTENMYASIDFVADKIERQLRKYKTRYTHKGNKSKDRRLVIVTEEELDKEPVAEGDEMGQADFSIEIVGPKIVRSNQIKLEQMMPEEACKHMDLLEHDFFMFINSETGKISTLYHRRDGNYGLIEPQY
jgi:putative sigma-54 modulation protein